MSPYVGVVIVAAGSGSRLGAEKPKAFVELGGVTLLQRALETALTLGDVQIVAVVPREWGEVASDICRKADGGSNRIDLVEGAGERHGSVGNGLAALSSGVDIVLVHDAARPLTPASVFQAVIAEVDRTGDGAAPALAVADTIKRVVDGVAVETVDRSRLAAMQTPQGFPLRQLIDAYSSSRDAQTDDAAVYAAAGRIVRVVNGHPLGFKITTSADLERAEHLVSTVVAGTGATRSGIGMDVHAFEESAELWLGGLHWPGETGLAGHSDGDALSHAICDALLSAAGLGDIGGRFGTADPRFAGAHGDVFLKRTVEDVVAAGFHILSVSVQLVGNRPKLAPRRAEVEEHLTSLVGAPVSVSATTTDGLGFTGRGEGIAAMATALVSGPVSP